MKRFLHLVTALALVLVPGVYAFDLTNAKTYHQGVAWFAYTYSEPSSHPAVLRVYPGDYLYDVRQMIVDRKAEGDEEDEDEEKTVLV